MNIEKYMKIRNTLDKMNDDDLIDLFTVIRDSLHSRDIVRSIHIVWRVRINES